LLDLFSESSTLSGTAFDVSFNSVSILVVGELLVV
jgi:hypothetical protein